MDILQKKLQDDNVELDYTKDFEDYMVEEGYSPEYGARPVKRLIQRELVNKLASEILQGNIRRDSKITADAKDGKVVLNN